MNSIAVIVLSICLFAVGCATDPYRVTKPYLYEITSKENSKKGYVFGVIDRGVIVDDLPSDFWPYFDQADIIVNQITNDLADKLNDKFVEYMWKDKTDRPIQEILSPAEFARVQSLVNLDLPRDSRKKFYDEVSLFGLYRFLIGSNIQMVEVTRGEHLRLSADKNLEKNMMKRASSKNVDSLEDSDGEYVMCIVQDDQTNLKRVRFALKMLNEKMTMDRFRLKAAAYRKGDSAGYLVASNEGIDSDNDYVSRLQHQSWAPRMASILKDSESPFFIVNVGSIIQPKQSLVEYINKLGYNIRRVSEIDLPEKK